jgi:putative IMPACT (imprinted ancient) family translation regulator
MAKTYESDITQFLKAYKKQHPDTEARQREGRARLWDKPQDPELLEGFRQARVPQKPYVYQAE